MRRTWHAANDAESRLLTRHDLLAVRERARALGGPRAAAQLEDVDWIRSNVRKAQRRRIPVKGYLLIAALEHVGVILDPDQDETMVIKSFHREDSSMDTAFFSL